MQRPITKPLREVFWQLLNYSKDVIGALIVIVTALVSLNGPTLILPGGVAPSRMSLFDTAMQSLASCALTFALLAASLVFKQRRNLRTIFLNPKNRNPLLFMGIYATAALLVLACFVMFFMVMLDASVLWLFFNAVAITIQFLFLPLLFYILTVSALFISRAIFYFNAQTGLIPPSNQKEQSSSNNWLQRYAGAVGSWSVAIALLLSLYSLIIYPVVPQSIGGGKAATVNILVEDTNVYKQELSDPNVVASLLLRTNEKLFLRLYNTQTSTSKIIELPDSDVKGISYAFPLPSSTNP